MQRPAITGLLEHVSPFRLQGWAFDRNQPLLALDLVLHIDGRPVHWFRPNLRADKIARYLGWQPEHLGLAGFDIPAPEILSDGREHRVEITHAASGTALPSLSSTVQYVNPYAGLDSLRPPRRVKPRLRRSCVPEVSVIVLNRNGSGVLRHLLESWQAHNRHPAVEWIVIDHASSDDSLQLLRAWKQRLPLRIKALKVNDSFSASCNLGARLARGEYLLFLNNDIVWLHDALPPMLQTLQQDPSAAIVGLKLLKATDAGGAAAFTEVQHLGVRFKQHDSGYWPYEASPSIRNREAEHTAQPVPIVTGAALLCRKVDFDAVGGFHTDYFYGFEDVELCLRMSHRLGRRVICRNDLVALHRHGHTRLTGREAPVLDRLRHNADILARHIGLWAKAAWWHSLLLGDRLLCAEPLTIGLCVGELPADGASPDGIQQAMSELGQHLLQHFAHASIVLLHPGIDPWEARDLHVLVATSPDYDIRRLHNARPDLRCLAWIAGQPQSWANAEWWHDFDGYLADPGSSARAARQLTKATGVVLDASTPEAPLGRWLCPPGQELSESDSGHSIPRSLGRLTALRVGIALHEEADRRRTGAAQASSETHELRQSGEQLRRTLKRQGAAVWWHAAPAPGGRSRTVDVCIHLLGKPPTAAGTVQPLQLDPSCLNVIWQLHPRATARRWLAAGSPAADLWLSAAPGLGELLQALEIRLGHTFSAP